MKLMFAERFRSLFQEPYAAAKEIGVSEGQNVVDIGAGKGYLTVPASTIVGKKGLVYSVEPDPKRSNRIRQRVATEGLENVHVLTTGPSSSRRFPQIASTYLTFLVFSIHYFNDEQAGLSEIRRILRNGGRFYVWDGVPGTIMRHGIRREELDQLSEGFTKFELMRTGRTVRARFTK